MKSFTMATSMVRVAITTEHVSRRQPPRLPVRMWIIGS